MKAEPGEAWLTSASSSPDFGRRRAPCAPGSRSCPPPWGAGTGGTWHRVQRCWGLGGGLSPGSALRPQPSWLCHGIAEAAPRSLVLPLPGDTRRFLTQRRRFVVHTPNKTCSPCLSPLPPSPPFFFSPFSHCSEHGEGSASGPGGDEPGAPEPPGAVGQRGLAAATGSVKGRMPLSGWEGFQQPAGRAPSLLPSSPLPLKEFEALGDALLPLPFGAGPAAMPSGTGAPCRASPRQIKVGL